MKIRVPVPVLGRAGPPLESGRKRTFLMAGGGTGGHVIPAIAVARELRRRGHGAFFVGTREGIESRLVPPEKFPLEYVAIGGLKGVGWRRVRTLLQLPVSVVRVLAMIQRYHPAAAFSMGGYVAGPATIAAWLMRVPIVLMEPNAVPGMTNRYIARVAKRALLSFPETQEYFPSTRIEMTGLPVRAEFFQVTPKERGEKLTVLVTGGSRGSRRLNEAGRACWPILKAAQFPVRWVHQSGSADYNEMQEAFQSSGLEGSVVPFIEDMPRAFGAADLVVGRSGAGAVAEIAAAGKPAVLVPFPHAADQHQLKNAQAMAQAGAARVILDHECSGEELFHTIQALAADRAGLARMAEAARQFARPDAARRTADILEEEAALAPGRKKG